MQTRVVKLNLSPKKRLLFISDIHGNLKLFKMALAKVKFSSDDYLFLLGDLIEKSYDNISLLDYVMELDKNDNVFVLQGNCDNVLNYMIENVDDKLLKKYALKKQNTILLDFARILNIEINENSNMEELCHLFYKEFRRYYDYVLNLPHAYIINNKICAVHGGISDLNNIDTEALNLMKHDGFYLEDNKLNMIEIVGHYPTINYHNDIPSINSIIDLDKRVISIDGGVSVIPWNQMNILTIDNIENMEIHNEYVDLYDKVKVLENETNLNPCPYNVTISPIKVDIKSYDEDFVLGYYDKYVLYILKEMLIKDNDGYYAYNAFNYFHNLVKGEEVSIIFKGKNLSIIKKDGVIGLCHTKNLEV